MLTFSNLRTALLALTLFAAAAVLSAQVKTTPGTSAYLFRDGTSGVPSLAFASEPTLGFWRSGAATVTVQASSFIASGDIYAAVNSSLAVLGRLSIKAPADGRMTITNNAATFGVSVKVDALPTVSSGFGTTPSITAGSTPFAGSVNVGTGGAATTGVIDFNGTAWPSAPFCIATPTLTNVPTRVTTITTTQVTLTTSTAWTASDVVNFICVSSK